MSHSANSAELDIFNARRLDCAQARQEAVAELIEARGLDAVLLTEPANLAWITCGADLSGGASGAADGGETAAAVFLTRRSRVLVCTDADSPHLFDRELPGLGFQLKQRPWRQPRAELLCDLCRGRVVGVDRPRGFEEPADAATDLRAALAELRAAPDPADAAALAELGADVAHAVEATCRGAKPGRTEADFVGEVAHRLLRRGITPALIRAAGDGRADDQPHYAFDRRPVLQRLALRAVGRRGGLHAHCGRTVAFPALPLQERAALLAAHGRAAQVQAAGLHHARAGVAWPEVWASVARVYETTGPAADWESAPVALRTGFAPTEAILGPDAAETLRPGVPLVWQPRIGPAALCDTALVTADGPADPITGMEDWPRVKVCVADTTLRRPGVLESPG
ncbi:M24 family metallopeptidase [Alienimonas californiensis]|uniref:Metallopeptidase family M24 n=1 Tax=Alienimonas californiensis TaxID=2527989 RepID=A0A517P3K4_9PLAN|nr:M24 family metallopeptidase [Alienimonas californiensis]QDT13952.1 Metallopeptidase family M24 [Alienimonas californiensis]